MAGRRNRENPTMADKPTTLSDTARIVLTRAAEHPERLASFHKKLPAGARHKVAESLLKQGFLDETAGAYRDAPVTEQDDGMLLTTLRLTDAGFRAIGQEPPAAKPDTAPRVASADAAAQEAKAVADALDAATVAPTEANGRDTLRHAAQAVLDAWDDEANRETDIITAMEVPIARLRAMLAGRAERHTAVTPRGPRQGTKQETVLAMLRRAEGASGPQIAEATGWNSNTVRGFLAGLKKKGFTIETLERVRMVGPNKEGARGSYSVYRVAG
jgi:biotin operon repressor